MWPVPFLILILRCCLWHLSYKFTAILLLRYYCDWQGHYDILMLKNVSSAPWTSHPCKTLPLSLCSFFSIHPPDNHFSKLSCCFFLLSHSSKSVTEPCTFEHHTQKSCLLQILTTWWWRHEKTWRTVKAKEAKCTDIPYSEWGLRNSSCIFLLWTSSHDLWVKLTATVPFCPAVVCSAGPNRWAVALSISSANPSAPWLPSVRLTSCKAIRNRKKCSRLYFENAEHGWK